MKPASEKTIRQLWDHVLTLSAADKLRALAPADREPYWRCFLAGFMVARWAVEDSKKLFRDQVADELTEKINAQLEVERLLDS